MWREIAWGHKDMGLYIVDFIFLLPDVIFLE